jgi:hypothetical protein
MKVQKASLDCYFLPFVLCCNLAGVNRLPWICCGACQTSLLEKEVDPLEGLIGWIPALFQWILISLLEDSTLRTCAANVGKLQICVVASKMV